MTPKCEVTSLCFSKLWSLPYTVDCCTWLKMVVVNLLSNYNLQTYLGNNASSDRPNWCIVRNQPNRIFGNSLSESSAEVRPNRTTGWSLIKDSISLKKNPQSIKILMYHSKNAFCTIYYLICVGNFEVFTSTNYKLNFKIGKFFFF